MSERHHVGNTSELDTSGSRLLTEIDGVEIAVFRHDDEFYALANYCPHQGGPLCEGELQGKVCLDDDEWSWTYDDNETYLACPWHGWLFDITTGESVDHETQAVPTYEVTISDGEVYVRL